MRFTKTLHAQNNGSVFQLQKLLAIPGKLLTLAASEALLGISRVIAYVLFIMLRYVLHYRKMVIRENLTAAFPSKSPDEVRRLMHTYYTHLGELIIEPFLFYLAPAALRKRLASYSNPELLDRLYKNQKQVITFASHYGNWEYLINLPEVTRYPVYTAYTPINNGLLNHMMIRLRSFLGVNLIPKKAFYRQGLSLLRQESVPKMLVIIADQRPAPGNDKFHISFMDQDTAVQIGGERMATASRSEVVYVTARKRGRFRYEFTFSHMENGSRDSPMDITKRYYRILEKSIDLAPGFWLWSHNRWKLAVG